MFKDFVSSIFLFFRFSFLFCFFFPSFSFSFFTLFSNFFFSFVFPFFPFRREVPTVKMTIFFRENLVLEPSVDRKGELRLAHLRVTSLSCFSFLFFHLFHFCFSWKKCVSSFLLFSFNYGSLLASVSEFNCRCFLRCRWSMEMWCPDDIGRESWDWVGPPIWERACCNSPEWGGGSSPIKKQSQPPKTVLLLLFWTRVNEGAM